MREATNHWVYLGPLVERYLLELKHSPGHASPWTANRNGTVWGSGTTAAQAIARAVRNITGEAIEDVPEELRESFVRWISSCEE